MVSFYHDVFKYLSQSTDKPNIIWGSTAHPFGTLAAYKLSKKFQVPFLYEIRDLWPLSIIEIGKVSRHHPFILYLDYLDKLFAFKSNLIITTAPLMKKYYIERWNLPESKFLWITNGTNLSMETEDEANQGLLAKKKKGTPFRVVYTGALGQANGLIDILQVISAHKKELRNFEFHFWGEGTSQKSLLRYIKEKGLACFIHAPVSKEKVSLVLQSADAFLFYLRPSVLYKYGISLNKLADYHAAGKPIIAVGECAQNPVIESGAGLIASSVRDLPQVLLKFEQLSVEEKIAMGEKGQQYAQKHYNWQFLTEKLYTQLKYTS
ncbi:hypothetical protein SDC9_147537 [bioreactor metagenome]|uniref:Glycosyltransferase subfamily 4-like N-terminal domain-containing protein n=2 Tax=root TaxID=1 RepID=A0A645EIC8_9ZZZZ